MAGVRGHGVKWGEAGGVGGHAARSEHLDSVQAPWKAGAGTLKQGRAAVMLALGGWRWRPAAGAQASGRLVAGPGGAGFVTD